ncbi:MAG TPA: sulfite exporter TauE/SafE family protein [Terriglobia bacterium]|nr:sulfite exporter TauE/SafE family protein [Terriglobia bacterium]
MLVFVITRSAVGELWPMMISHWVLIFVASALAGLINSVAGGGTLVTFPTLVWLGQPPIIANATNTAAIWPGSLGSLWGYRQELRSTNRQLYLLVIPSLVGGIVGAILLKQTPPGVFAELVPFLILFATLLFTVQGPVQRWLRLQELHRDGITRGWMFMAGLFQFAVAVYGGYFGAGIGILMLAALSVLGLTEIHQMNGLKSLFAMCINAVAAFYFMASGLVAWKVAAVMVVGATASAYGGAGIARRLDPRVVRRIVIGIGFAMAVSLFLERLKT